MHNIKRTLLSLFVLFVLATPSLGNGVLLGSLGGHAQTFGNGCSDVICPD